jgi:hypothetical protein
MKQVGTPHFGFGRMSMFLLLVAGLSAFALPTSVAQDDGLIFSEGRSGERNPTQLELPPAIVTSQTQFEIPFRTDDLNGRLVEVQLYVSTDLAQSWNVYARQSPLTTRIPFQSVGDGEYLFALKTLDRDGRLMPTGPPIPTLRMIVDTVQPELNLRVEPDKSGRIAITWRGTDQNLDKSTLRLSYRVDGPNLPNTWHPLGTGSPPTTDQAADATLFQDRVTWFPDAVAEAIILKAEIQDFAGNLVTTYQPIGLGNLRSAMPAPLLQGGQSNSLSPPDPTISGNASVGNPTAGPGTASPTSQPAMALTASNPGAPIDWPSTPTVAGSQPNSFAGGQLNRGDTWGRSTGNNSGTGRVEASPAQWTRGNSVVDPNPLPGTPNPMIDPFRRMLAEPGTGPGTDTGLGTDNGGMGRRVAGTDTGIDPGTDTPFSPRSDNLSVAVGTTLRPPAGDHAAQPTSAPNRELPITPFLPNPPGRSESVTVPDAIREGTVPSGNAPSGNTGRTEAKGDRFPEQPNTLKTPETPTNPNIAYFRVNTLQFRLRYQVDGLQPHQIGAVTIFGSRDKGRSWELWTEDRDKTSPVEIAVPTEGSYAFRVVVTSSTGSSSRIPRPGDEPEIVVDVDSEPPIPRIVAAPYGRGAQPASLLIQWTCEAIDLGPKPVSLAYSHTLSGPWTTITPAVENSGQFEWGMEPNLPRQVYLQIEVTDTAGNRGRHILESPIDIGPLLPRGRILGLDR